MSQTEHLSFYFDTMRLLKLLHSQLLEIPICPHIVISLEEIDFDTPVHKRLQSSENPYISLWNHIPVLIPEIPYVTQKIYGIRLLRKAAQKVGKTTLTRIRVRNLKTKMNVRNKICKPTGRHYAKMNMLAAATRQ
jgi:hypothetical protein